MSEIEREARAARNQAMFRAVNEKMVELNDVLSNMSGEYAISCECADTTCIRTVSIAPEAYLAVRANPRQFVVLPGHVLPELEQIVAQNGCYVVVEKHGTAGELALDFAELTGD